MLFNKHNTLLLFYCPFFKQYGANFSRTITIKSLTFSSERQSVVALPSRFAGSTNCVCECMSFTKTSGTSAGGGEATHLTMLHDRFTDPVDLGVTTDCLVERIHHDDFKELVRRVLTYPIGVQNT